MLEKIIELLKEKNFQVPSLLLYHYKDFKIKELDVLLLIYFINHDSLFNPKEVSEKMNLSMPEVLESITRLSESDLIKVELKTKDGLREEHINLEHLYEKLGMLLIDDVPKQEEKKVTIFDHFEQEFGRTLSPTEYQIIQGWLEMEYGEELILEALKEAVYNGVSNLRYIDKILYEWRKQGIKSKSDVERRVSEKKEFKPIDREILEYDWLNED